jgi:uncharacterized secreted protein with C-terminal beta-propeller domain
MAWTPTSRRRTALGLEQLEDRCLLDANPATAPLALPTHFASAAEFQQFLIDTAVARWSSVLGTHFQGPTGIDPIPLVGPGVATPVGTAAVAASAVGAAQTAANGFSQTNVQVPGVDEGDIVKTDGNYLYLLRGQQLDVIDARPGHDPAIVSQTTINGQPIAEYLDGQHLTVLSSVYLGGPIPVDPLPVPVPGSAVPQYTQPVQITSRVQVTVFDVTNAAAPQAIQTNGIDGNYVESRAVGDKVYVVVQNTFDNLPPPKIQTTGTDNQYETEAQYRADLATYVANASSPHVYSVEPGDLASGPILDLADPARTYKPVSSDDGSLVSVVTYDLTGNSGPGPIDAVSAVGSYASNVYASADNLYVLTPHWSPNGGDSTTVLERFALGGGHPDLTAVGQVPGQVLNQFSMDESGGTFRIATTTFGGQTPSSNVYVLTADQGVLKVSGSLENLTPGEQIYSVRFAGDRGYVSTFKQTDPLLTLDLSDPSHPRVAGELQLPGFSRYLQPIDDTHLIGIGRDVDPTTGRTGPLQVSLFDVSDPTAPRLVDRYTIATDGWTGSDAEYDAHAIGYFPDYRVLALPVYGYEAGTWEMQSALWVFQVDPASGFKLLGKVGDDTQVRRSVRVGDRLFSIAYGDVKSTPITQPGTDVRQVALHDPDLSAQAVPVTATAGTAFNGVVSSFTLNQPGAVDATINWGDGQFSPGTVQPNAQGGYDVVGSHTYAATGTHDVGVTLSRPGDAQTLVEGTAQVNGDGNQRFVARLYRDLLDRDADADGLAAWQQMLDQGGDRAAVVRGIEGSVEYRTKVVQQLYQEVLGRPAEAFGLGAWLKFLADGGTAEQLRAYILASDEYYAVQGQGTRQGFLHALYQEVLHRDIDAVGLKAWATFLAHGFSRRDAAAAILGSVETQTQLVQGWYTKLLHRTADDFGLQVFVGAMQHGAKSHELLLDVLISDEYFAGA